MNNKEDDNAYAVVEELPMENIVSEDNICYDHVLASVCANTKNTTSSPATRESCKGSKTKLIIAIVVIVLVLSAICAGTIYTVLELSRLKSEVASSNMISSKLMKNRSASLEQTMKASLDMLCQQMYDLAGLLNISIEQIQLRENEKQQITYASLDVLHQLIDNMFRFHPTSCATILQLNSSSPSGYYSITSSNGSPIRAYCDMSLSCGNITGGWMRVAELDMTDNNTQCLSILTQRIDSNKRTCAVNSNSASCAPVIYSTNNIEW